MTKKKQPEPEPDYTEFCIKFSKLCMKLSLIFIKSIHTLSKYAYKKILLYLAWRQLKKDVKDCAACRDYFQEQQQIKVTLRTER